MSNDYSEDREILNTRNMLESAFFENLANPGTNKTSAKTTKTVKEIEIAEAPSNINTEKLLLELYDIRDEMIENCKDVDVSSKVASSLTRNINKIGSFIKSYGGKVDEFDPLSSASGLEVPDVQSNAERVIENTRRSYKLGQIKEAAVGKNGKELIIAFTGQRGNVDYKALGTISANGSWTGSEAIDYIYTAGSGKMSVKALSNEGKWIDKSSDFNVSWELWEEEAKPQQEVKVVEEIKTAGKDEKNVEIKEEVKSITQNNLDDENIGDDFPIEEK